MERAAAESEKSCGCGMEARNIFGLKRRDATSGMQVPPRVDSLSCMVVAQPSCCAPTWLSKATCHRTYHTARKALPILCQPAAHLLLVLSVLLSVGFELLVPPAGTGREEGGSKVRAQAGAAPNPEDPVQPRRRAVGTAPSDGPTLLPPQG